MIVVGLTSGVACGKSTVARFFRQMKVAVIDSDEIVSMLYAKDRKLHKRLISVFGTKIFDKKNKKIKKPVLRKIVFVDKKKLKKLNSIVHPKVYAEIKKQLKKSRKSKKKIVVVDIPLLIETKGKKLVDYVIVVKAKKKVQISRLRKRDKLTRKEALERISLQMPLSKKIKAADFVIDNSYSYAETKRQVKNVFKQLVFSL